MEGEGKDGQVSAEAKAELRVRLLAARKALSPQTIAAARAAVGAAVLRERAARGWRCVAGYLPLPTEPGSFELLATLRAEGVRVLAPVLLDDRDLDWAEWTPGSEWAPGSMGPTLGVGAIGAADAVLVPALAVARDGARLGRGGGSYDRALARARPGISLAALLYESEWVESIPRDPWDVSLSAVVTPAGWRELG
jgi:5-formyltetrahydrofolate cyclo-ligase